MGVLGENLILIPGVFPVWHKMDMHESYRFRFQDNPPVRANPCHCGSRHLPGRNGHPLGSIGAQQNLWPLPGLYFIEMAVLSLVCALLAFVADNPLSHFITWVSVGIFTGFSILGAWSVGFFYLPVAVIFAVIAIRSDLRNKRHIAAHIGVWLIAGLVQVILMLVVIRSLY
jgi:hypothetical protein